jgi:hypothetical protein
VLSIADVRDLVIRPALEAIGLYSPAAEQLLIGTGLQESGFRKLRQYGKGPALGLWQMEPFTHDDLWATYLNRKPDLAARLREICVDPAAGSLAWNLRYAAAMCRVKYYRVPAKLPAADDIEAQAAYWKMHYNTPLGRGTVAEYLETWHRYVNP